MIELKIFETDFNANPVTVDISQTVGISINKNVMKMEDPSKQEGATSYEFDILGTPNNLHTFNWFGNHQSPGGATYITRRAILEVDGNIIFSGRFLITEFNRATNMYRGRLMSDLANVIAKLGTTKVKELTNLNTFNHVFNGASSIKESWEGYCFKVFSLYSTKPLNIFIC